MFNTLSAFTSMNRRFSIRTLMVFTLVIAAVIVCLTRFNPWYDDTGFVLRCVAHKGKKIAEFVEFADAKNREVVKTVDSNGTLLGLSVHARDGQFVYIYVAEHDELKSTTGVWDESFFADCKITAVETYRIDVEHGSGFTLEPTKISMPENAR